jgi:hypothetical protein
MKRLLALTLLAAACGTAPVDESDETFDRPHVIKGIDLKRRCDHTLSYAGNYPSFSAGDGPSVSFELCSPSAALHQIKGWFVAGGESYCFSYPSEPSAAPINPSQFRRCADSFEFQLPSAGPIRFFFRGVNALGEVVTSGSTILERAGDNDFSVPLVP